MAVVSNGTTLIDNGALDSAVPTGSLVLLSTQTASASASIEFTSDIDSTYDSYVFKFIDINPSVDGNFTFQGSTDGGSSFLTDSHYDFAFSNINSDDNNQQFETEVNQAAINISGATTQGNATGEAGSFIADIFDRVIQINILVPESKLYSKEDLEKVTLNKKRILNEIYTYIPTSLGETIKLKRGVA